MSVAAAPRPELAVFRGFCAALTLEDGRPFRLEPFEERLLADYFAGALETLVLLPKKNGKTTLLSALALYHLLSTPDAECVIGAASRDQATILYDQACGFVRRSDELQDRVAVKRGYREIRSRRDSGRIRVLAADVDTADGVIPTLALVDELHRHKDVNLYGVFRDGLGPRAGRMVTISTAGDNELSPLGQMRMKARRLPGVVQEGGYTYARAEGGSFVMHEWALEPGEDTADLEVVKRANPASWQTLEALAVRQASPSTLPWHWLRFACGLWVGSEPWWMRPAEWEACQVEAFLEPGERITLGFDGSQSGDATALVACRVSDGLVQPVGLWQAPPAARDWQVPRGAVDACMADLMESYDVARVYCDPPLWITEIEQWAREFGDTVVLKYPTKLTRMMEATDRFRADVVAGRLRHTGDEALTRHVLSAQVKEARGGYWLTKSRPGTPDKIDLAVAAILAYEARADVLATKVSDKRPGRLYTF